MRVYGKQMLQTAVGHHLPPDVIGVIANYLPRSWRPASLSPRERAIAEFTSEASCGRIVRLRRTMFVSYYFS